MGTRYHEGDRVTVRNTGEKARVRKVRGVHKDSPNYDIETVEGVKETVNASEINKNQMALEGWKREALEELQRKEDVPLEKQELGLRAGFAAGGKVSEYNGSEYKEFMIFKDRDHARRHAINKVEDDLKFNPEMFDDNFIEEYYHVPKKTAERIAREEADRIIRRKVDKGIYEEVDSEDALEESEEIQAEWINHLTSNPIEYLVDYKGMYSRETLLEQDWMHIKNEEAAEEAVKTDGIAHFLADYDHFEIRLPSGAVAYRTH